MKGRLHKAIMGWLTGFVVLSGCSNNEKREADKGWNDYDVSAEPSESFDGQALDSEVRHGDESYLDRAQGDVEDAQSDSAEVSGEDATADTNDGAVTVWPQEALTPLAIEKWLGAYIGTNDPVEKALERAEFEPPQQAGADKNGVKWFELQVDENGKLGFSGYGMFYAVGHANIQEDTKVIVRADNVYRVFSSSGHNPQLGDFYGGGRIRVPLALKASEPFIIVQAWGGEFPEVQAWTTQAEIFINDMDITAPDLVLGDTSEQWLGVAVLNLTGNIVSEVEASVLENEYFQATTVVMPALAPVSVTQVPFLLKPRQAADEAGKEVPAKLHLESKSLKFAYETTVVLRTVSGEDAFKRTRRSKVDGSVQYYAVLPPKGFEREKTYGLVLALHGAGVEALGHAQAYSRKDFAYIVAPTNRRPFGFDWEEWGRLDALEALEDAMRTFNIDNSRVYVTGHSMGGHGTWQLGVLYPGIFRVVAPSAGWASFYTYTGAQKPVGAIGRARASSDTLAYVQNLAKRAVYILHGAQDDNVPVSEAITMHDALEGICSDLQMHIQEGASHWWDGDEAEGVDCVDWNPIFETMRTRVLDPFELDFVFITPSPRVNATHSYVTIVQQADMMADSVVASSFDGQNLALNTTNCGSLKIRGDVLLARGISSLVVDGLEIDVENGEMLLGDGKGKRPDAYGPFNQVFERPFCFVVPNIDSREAEYASYLTTAWSVLGNGSSCVVATGDEGSESLAEYNLMFVGVDSGSVPLPVNFPVSWDAQAIRVRDRAYHYAALAMVFPCRSHLCGVLTTTQGSSYLLFRHIPFTSRSGLPDYTVWSDQGLLEAGFFDAQWK
jgi:poly(3-hydroxybutyrate) depolymerase